MNRVEKFLPEDGVSIKKRNKKMALFKVIAIIDGDTIKITPNWKLNGREGDTVRIFGYITPKQGDETTFAKNKLEKLLLNQFVELKSPSIPYGFPEGTCTCRVFRNSVDISRYFPEFANF